MVAAFLFPVVAIFYLEAGLVIHDLARYAAGQDSILNGVYHYPLANGYSLGFSSEPGPQGGWMEAPRGSSLPVGRIHGLQVAGDFMFLDAERLPQQGTVPTVTVIQGEMRQPAIADRGRVFIELDTKTHNRADYSSLEELRRAAANRNIDVQLIPLQDFYYEAVSAASPGPLFWGLLGAPPLIAFVTCLWRWLHILRSRNRSR
jgi:hypothetical protein